MYIIQRMVKTPNGYVKETLNIHGIWCRATKETYKADTPKEAREHLLDNQLEKYDVMIRGPRGGRYDIDGTRML